MATRRKRRETFGICLGRLSRLWRAEIDRRLSTHGITDAQGLTLLHLSRLEEPATQKMLAAAVGVQEPTMARMLDRLELEGLVRREVAHSDRRARAIHLTPEAAPGLARIRKVAESLRDELFDGIDDAELDVCLVVFEQLVARLSKPAPTATDSAKTSEGTGA